METSKKTRLDTKKVFRQCGTCSQTFAHLLNREFGHPKETEERAIDPLAGGIMNLGHQCGMLWGSALAVGADAYRRHDDPKQAIAAAITATQHIVDSFLSETSTVNCRKITGFNLNSFLGMAGFMVKTMIKGMDNSLCFNLAEKWAPEAIQAATKGLSEKQLNHYEKELLERDEELVELLSSENFEEEMVDYVEDQTDRLHYWFGDLTPAQMTIVAKHTKQTKEGLKRYLEKRRKRRALLMTKVRLVSEEELKVFFDNWAYQPNLRSKLANIPGKPWDEWFKEFLLDIFATLNKRQKAQFNERLEGIMEDLRAFSRVS